MKKLSALCIALLLAACSDGGSIGSGPFLPGTGNPTPPAETGDSFYSRVLNIIGVANDDADSITLDDVLTTPEDTEPVALS